MLKERILVTGSSGFVGSALIERLRRTGPEIVLAHRDAVQERPGYKSCVVGDLSSGNDWSECLNDCTVVIHCAARVHVMHDKASDPLTEFRKVNVEGTLNLARQAAQAGVKRFVFISSIKVNGEGTRPGKAYQADDQPAPVDPYGISKHEAEQGIRQIAADTGMEAVIIRPVLIYGPGVKANFRSMMSWLSRGVPLPLGAIHNRRSLVALDNLVDLIITCISHPGAANKTFLVSDGEDLSTTELLHRMAHALDKPARLIPVPEKLITCSAKLIGRESMAQRLCGSLQVDIEKTRNLLGWHPPVAVSQALRETARDYLQREQASSESKGC